MTRDMGLIRELLLKLEGWPLKPGTMTVLNGNTTGLDIEGRSAAEVDYHLLLIREAGFIDAPGRVEQNQRARERTCRRWH
jgi:hypothetical protein